MLLFTFLVVYLPLLCFIVSLGLMGVVLVRKKKQLSYKAPFITSLVLLLVPVTLILLLLLAGVVGAGPVPS